MTVTKDLLLSILSMDAYNRRYDAGISLLGNSGSVGIATIGKDSGGLVDAAGNRLDQAAGFYALSYTLGGETIISYRGTDRYFGNSVIGGDIWNGCSHCN